MTTGFKPSRTEAGQRRATANWIWLAATTALVIALIVVAVNSSKRNDNTGRIGTNSSVQSSGTGQQGSVGKFSQPLIPNSNPSETPKSDMDINTVPDPKSNANGANAKSDATGNSAGAGNTGITTATDSLGGSTPADSSSQSGQ